MAKRSLHFALLGAACFSVLIVAAGSVYRCLAADHGQQGQLPIAGFPQSEQFLQHLMRSADVEGIRAHGWNLLEQLTQSGSPAWETEPDWKNKCDLKLTSLCPEPAGAIGQRSSTVGNGSNQILYTVYYSLDAANWITSNGLNDGTSLQKMLASGNSQIVPPPPPTAIAVKEIWEGFPFNPSDKPFVNVYDPYRPQSDPTDAHKLASPITTWQTQLPIKLNSKGDLDTDADCQADYPTKETIGVTVGNVIPVPINCFRYLRAPDRCDELAMFKPVSQTLQSSFLEASKPCVLVLVGVEFATKEMANWTWTTYWWVNMCNADTTGRCTAPGTEGRNTARLPQQFQHFAMGTMLTPDVVPPGHDADPTLAVYNPYFEGIKPGGTVTNCMSCHSEAVYVPNCDFRKANCKDPIRNGLPNASMNAVPGVPPCLPSKIASDLARCPLKTSFLWSIADNQNSADNATPPTLPTPITFEMTLKRDKILTGTAPTAVPKQQ